MRIDSLLQEPLGLRRAELYPMNTVNPIAFEDASNPGSGLDLSSWYAVQTVPRHEKKVDADLRRKGVGTFLPLLSEKRQWGDRQQLVDLPLFPGYVFVQIAAGSSTRVPVLRTSGVTRFVGVRGIGTPIPDTEIAAVKGVVERKVPFRSFDRLEVGKRVRVRGGSLDGVEGVLVAVKGEQRLVISIELIQRSLSLAIEGYCVEPV